MKLLVPQLALLALGLVLLTCTGPIGTSTEEASNEDTFSASEPQSELRFDGTVQYREIEGGAWVIESTEGYGKPLPQPG